MKSYMFLSNVITVALCFFMYGAYEYGGILYAVGSVVGAVALTCIYFISNEGE